MTESKQLFARDILLIGICRRKSGILKGSSKRDCDTKFVNTHYFCFSASPNYIIAFQFVAADTDLILTEAPAIPHSLRRVTDEQVFEEMGFRSLFCPSSAFLALVAQKGLPSSTDFAFAPCHVVVDCGYSSTTISLFLDEIRLNYATIRVNAGGKLLTNYLKEMISYRHVLDTTRQ